MGSNDPLELVALHGFTGSGADFDVLREALTSSVRWTTPDLPGHGENLAPFAAAYTVPAMAAAVAAQGAHLSKPGQGLVQGAADSDEQRLGEQRQVQVDRVQVGHVLGLRLGRLLCYAHCLLCLFYCC